MIQVRNSYKIPHESFLVEFLVGKSDEDEQVIEVIPPKRRRRLYRDLPYLPKRVIEYDEIEDVMNTNKAR